MLALSVDDEIDFFKDLNLSETDEQIAAPILKEVSSFEILTQCWFAIFNIEPCRWNVIRGEKRNEFV